MTGRLLAYLLDTKRLIPSKPVHLMSPMRDSNVDYLDPSYWIYQIRCSARAWIQLRFHSHCRVYLLQPQNQGRACRLLGTYPCSQDHYWTSIFGSCRDCPSIIYLTWNSRWMARKNTRSSSLAAVACVWDPSRGRLTPKIHHCNILGLAVRLELDVLSWHLWDADKVKQSVLGTGHPVWMINIAFVRGVEHGMSSRFGISWLIQVKNMTF